MQPAVLVTGASSGIGRECTVRFAGAGWRVFAGVRDLAVGEEIATSTPGSIEPVSLDVTEPEAIEASRAAIAERVGAAGLRGLVNNAGVGVGGPLEYVPMDDLRRQFEVNVFGPVAVARAMLPLLRAGRGRIVLVSSDSGRWVPPFTGPYAASKFALEALGDALRFELHRAGARVSIVEPGSVETQIWGKSFAALADLDLPEESVVLYGDVKRVMRLALEDSRKNAVSPGDVAEVIATAMTARRPRIRYRVGRDARAMIALRAALPDLAFDLLVRLAMRRLERRPE